MQDWHCEFYTGGGRPALNETVIARTARDAAIPRPARSMLGIASSLCSSQ
jgi:hypothetical protein